MVETRSGADTKKEKEAMSADLESELENQSATRLELFQLESRMEERHQETLKYLADLYKVVHEGRSMPGLSHGESGPSHGVAGPSHGAPYSPDLVDPVSPTPVAPRSEQRRERRTDPVRSDAQHYYAGVTRLGRIDFPRFDGSNMKEWLFKAEEFFGVDFTPEDMKVKTAAIHFDSHAAAWHHSFVQTREGLEVLYDWNAYVLLLKERFEDVCDDPMAELKQLQETDGIVEYHQRFELIKLRVKLSEEYLVSAYLAGLRLDTQMHVRMFQPRTVRHCLLLGRLYEKAHPKKPFNTTWSPKANSVTPPARFIRDNEVKTESQWGKGTAKSFAQTPKKLSQQEMSERRAKGLCFLCDEKYTPEHYLVHKKTQLYSMEVEEEFVDAEEVLWGDSEGEDKNMPQISVNALIHYCNI